MTGQAKLALSESAFSEALVGRAAEMRRAEAVLGRARRGRGQVLGLTGEAGVGKSRLAAEVARLARRLGFDVHVGACRAYGSTTAYLAWQPIWRALFAVDPSLQIADQQAELGATVAARDRRSGQRAPLLAPAVGLPMPNSELTASLEPQARAELLWSLLLDHVRAVAAATPLLMVLEDCHWIDPASLALLEFLARNIADQAIMIVATRRPSGAGGPDLAALAALPHFTEAWVADLSAADAERLVAQRIRSVRGETGGVAPAVIRQIVMWAGGNPLHLEELVAFLLAPGPDPSERRAFAGLDQPEDLRRLVLARTERLTASQKLTIEVASVIGTRFAASWIWGSHPATGEPEQVLSHLERLTELGLTRRSPDSAELEYAFKHAITREAVYEG
jgi:predicted ATPase